LRDGLVDRLEIDYGPVVAGEGGPSLGDLGVRTMGDAVRWRTVAVERADHDVVWTLEAPIAAGAGEHHARDHAGKSGGRA
jgi:riboflavin biosynthesis pyrimidine reductase